MMVALQVDRARIGLSGIEGAPGGSGDLLVIDGGDAVEHHRHPAPDEGDVVSLPIGTERG